VKSPREFKRKIAPEVFVGKKKSSGTGMRLGYICASLRWLALPEGCGLLSGVGSRGQDREDPFRSWGQEAKRHQQSKREVMDKKGDGKSN